MQLLKIYIYKFTMSFLIRKKKNQRKQSRHLSFYKMNRAPTTVSVPPIRSQHGSGVRKRKYKRRRGRKNIRKGGRKQKSNVRRRKGRAMSKLLKHIIKG